LHLPRLVCPVAASNLVSSRKRPTSARRRALLKLSASLCVAGLLAGCETKGWIDPKEVGRFKHEPLVMPILKTFDPGVEENNPEFATATDPTAADRSTATGEYHISPNDLISVEITDLMGPGQATVKTTRVSESGKISLPYIKTIEVEGLTEYEAEEAISDAYRLANLITNAQVSVNVVEARGRSFEVLGAVARPNIYAIPEANFRLLDALVLGGDVSSPLIDYIYILRRPEPVAKPRPATRPAASGPATAPTSAPSIDDLAPKQGAAGNESPLSPLAVSADHPLNLMAGSSETDSAASANSAISVQLAQVSDAPNSNPPGQSSTPSGAFQFNAPPNPDNLRVIRIPYQALHNGDLNYNITIRPHDVIIVQQLQTGVYYVAGHVARPGVFTLTGQKITVKQAVMSAGMFDELAIPQRTEIVRRIRPDHEVAIRIDLDKIFRSDQPDVYLKPDDQILVGTNAIAPFLAAVRGAFRATYGFGFLYDRNLAYSTNNAGGGGF
jgi:polysaccharide biosynthesis/export protein